MFNVLSLVGTFKGDNVFFMIEIHSLRIAHAHLMVVEFSIKLHLNSKNWRNFCHSILLERQTSKFTSFMQIHHSCF